MTKRILLSVLLFVFVYMASYTFFRVQGSILIDPHRKKLFKVVERDSDKGFMYSPILDFYRPAYSLEGFLPERIALGSSKYDVRYEGDYPPDEAERMAIWILGEVPDGASDFRGEYDCKFYDDRIVQSIQFNLSHDAWVNWRSRLIDAMKDFRGAETVVERNGGLHADYGSSAGYLDITFAESTVTLVRQVHD